MFGHKLATRRPAASLVAWQVYTQIGSRVSYNARSVAGLNTEMMRVTKSLPLQAQLSRLLADTCDDSCHMIAVDGFVSALPVISQRNTQTTRQDESSSARQLHSSVPVNSDVASLYLHARHVSQLQGILSA